MPAKLKTSANIEDIKRLYLRAHAHSKTVSRNGKETRHIEAFLLQTALLEGVLANYGLLLLGKRPRLSALKGKRRDRYGYDNAINDLYLLGVTKTEEFKKLEQFKNKRNKYIHNLLAENTELVEKEVLKIYKEYEILVWDMIERLEKELAKKSR